MYLGFVICVISHWPQVRCVPSRNSFLPDEFTANHGSHNGYVSALRPSGDAVCPAAYNTWYLDRHARTGKKGTLIADRFGRAMIESGWAEKVYLGGHNAANYETDINLGVPVEIADQKHIQKDRCWTRCLDTRPKHVLFGIGDSSIQKRESPLFQLICPGEYSVRSGKRYSTRLYGPDETKPNHSIMREVCFCVDDPKDDSSQTFRFEETAEEFAHYEDEVARTYQWLTGRYSVDLEKGTVTKEDLFFEAIHLTSERADRRYLKATGRIIPPNTPEVSPEMQEFEAQMQERHEAWLQIQAEKLKVTVSLVLSSIEEDDATEAAIQIATDVIVETIPVRIEDIDVERRRRKRKGPAHRSAIY